MYYVYTHTIYLSIYIYTHIISLRIRFDGECSFIHATNSHQQNQCRVFSLAGNCQAEKKAEEEREAEAKRDLMAWTWRDVGGFGIVSKIGYIFGYPLSGKKMVEHMKYFG